MTIDLARYALFATPEGNALPHVFEDQALDDLISELTPGALYPMAVLRARYVELGGALESAEAVGMALARKPGWRRGRRRVNGVVTRLGGIAAGATD